MNCTTRKWKESVSDGKSLVRQESSNSLWHASNLFFHELWWPPGLFTVYLGLNLSSFGLLL